MQMERLLTNNLKLLLALELWYPVYLWVNPMPSPGHRLQIGKEPLQLVIWYAIVTDDDEILIFDNTGNEIQKIKVNFKIP